MHLNILRLQTPGMWRRIIWHEFTDVSKRSVASTFRKKIRLDSVTFTLPWKLQISYSVLISTYVHISIPTSLQLQLFVQNAITPDGISLGCHIKRMRFVFQATDHILLRNVTSSLIAKWYCEIPRVSTVRTPASLWPPAKTFLYDTNDIHLLQHTHLNTVHVFTAKFTHIAHQLFSILVCTMDQSVLRTTDQNGTPNIHGYLFCLVVWISGNIMLAADVHLWRRTKGIDCHSIYFKG